jgi:hypothetical protein
MKRPKLSDLVFDRKGTQRMRAHAKLTRPSNPFHPGEVLKKDFIEPMKISRRSLANQLGWTLAKLNG